MGVKVSYTQVESRSINKREDKEILAKVFSSILNLLPAPLTIPQNLHSEKILFNSLIKLSYLLQSKCHYIPLYYQQHILYGLLELVFVHLSHTQTTSF